MMRWISWFHAPDFMEHQSSYDRFCSLQHQCFISWIQILAKTKPVSAMSKSASDACTLHYRWLLTISSPLLFKQPILWGGPKNMPLYFCPYLRQLLPDFQNSFTGTLCRQFVITWLYRFHHTINASLHYLAKYQESVNNWRRYGQK